MSETYNKIACKNPIVRPTLNAILFGILTGFVGLAPVGALIGINRGIKIDRQKCRV